MSKIGGRVDTIENIDTNRCILKYHDDKGTGKIDTFTNARSWKNYPDGGFFCNEQIRQVSVRRSLDTSRQPSQNIGDYTLQYSFSPPAGTPSGKAVSPGSSEVTL